MSKSHLPAKRPVKLKARTVHDFPLEVSGGEHCQAGVPRMIRRIRDVLDGLPEILINTRRLAEKLGVTHGAVLMHTASPLLRDYRHEHGTNVYWGNKTVIRSLHENQESGTVGSPRQGR